MSSAAVLLHSVAPPPYLFFSNEYKQEVSVIHERAARHGDDTALKLCPTFSSHSADWKLYVVHNMLTRYRESREAK